MIRKVLEAAALCAGVVLVVVGELVLVTHLPRSWVG